MIKKIANSMDRRGIIRDVRGGMNQNHQSQIYKYSKPTNEEHHMLH